MNVFFCLNIKKNIDFLETKKIEKKYNVTNLSNHTLNNLNKNNLWVIQKIKFIEQISVKINNV